MISVLWYLHAKEKDGRLTGDGGILREAKTATWFQGGYYEDGRPHGLTKIENNHVQLESVLEREAIAYYNTGFILEPLGGVNMQAGQSSRLSSSFGSTRRSTNLRPQHTVNVDSNYFRNVFGASHDFSAGSATVASMPSRERCGPEICWSASTTRSHRDSPDSTANPIRWRESIARAPARTAPSMDFYIGETLSKGRLTVDLGVRYDRQWGAALPSATQSNGAFPNVVPGIVFAGYDTPFTFNDVSPRAGITWALDDSRRRTIVRANYSRYAGQLDTPTIGYMNPSSNAGFADYG